LSRGSENLKTHLAIYRLVSVNQRFLFLTDATFKLLARILIYLTVEIHVLIQLSRIVQSLGKDLPADTKCSSVSPNNIGSVTNLYGSSSFGKILGWDPHDSMDAGGWNSLAQ
jgi:hypothetical protein